MQHRLIQAIANIKCQFRHRLTQIKLKEKSHDPINFISTKKVQIAHQRCYALGGTSSEFWNGVRCRCCSWCSLCRNQPGSRKCNCDIQSFDRWLIELVYRSIHGRTWYRRGAWLGRC